MGEYANQVAARYKLHANELNQRFNTRQKTHRSFTNLRVHTGRLFYQPSALLDATIYVYLQCYSRQKMPTTGWIWKTMISVRMV